MFDGKITHSDAEKAVDDGSYKSAPDEVLREMRMACLNVSGSNVTAVDRVRKKGDIIEQELSAREKSRHEQQSSIVLSEAKDADQPVSEKVLDTTPTDWDEAKLNEMIQNGIEENFGVEYKAAAALSREPRKVSEVTKDVSSMANSAGGILIYGISQFQDASKEHLPERIDPVLRSHFSKEWLEHIISQIRPRVSGLKIYSVQLASASDHVAYVIEIPQGATAHQANDFRYYRRYNFEAVPMLDHEVRDVMSRKTHPRLVVSVRFCVYPHPNDDGTAGTLIINVKNESDVFARYVAFVVHAPLRVGGRLIGYSGAVLDKLDEGHAYRLSFSNHDAAPLFPRGVLTKNFQFKFLSRMTPEPEKQLKDFRWVVFADSMPMQSGLFSAEEISK